MDQINFSASITFENNLLKLGTVHKALLIVTLFGTLVFRTFFYLSEFRKLFLFILQCFNSKVCILRFLLSTHFFLVDLESFYSNGILTVMYDGS